MCGYLRHIFIKDSCTFLLYNLRVSLISPDFSSCLCTGFSSIFLLKNFAAGAPGRFGFSHLHSHMISEGHILQPCCKTVVLTPRHGITTGPGNSTTLQLTDQQANILKLEYCTVITSASHGKLYFSVLCSSMPCKVGEKSMNSPEPNLPFTPAKPAGNGGFSWIDPTDQMDSKDESKFGPIRSCRLQNLSGYGTSR
jgi:hypothetical protein